MLKRKSIYLILLFFCLATANTHAEGIDTTLVKKMLVDDLQSTNDGDLARYLNNYFFNTPFTDIPAARNYMTGMLKKYRSKDAAAFELFISGVIEKRLTKYNQAERNFSKAIAIAQKTGNHYLLFSLHSNQAFIQASKGNSAAAMINYRLAQKEAIALDDINRHILLAINISDLYYKNNLFTQSLQYLDQAEAMATSSRSKQFHHENFIYFNKAEIYFKMNKRDSLNKYYRLLLSPKRAPTGIYNFRKRAAYFVEMAEGEYPKAINDINTLRNDSQFSFGDEDLIYLADAYHKAGMNDSAKVTINTVFKAIGKDHNPFLKHHLYQMLGQIALSESDRASAAKYLSLALTNLQDHTDHMVQVANISSEMKIDQIAGDFIRREEQYKRQRLMLTFAVVVSGLLVAIIIMFYRSVRQKRYYEQLIYKNKQQELAFINSHEVRRHLSNILGLVDLVQDKSLTNDEGDRIIKDLHHSAESLDRAIKNISEKLDS
ncbi:hypothetical protein IM792_05110 [Mucilaginibacter sp. JRF]|uniref:hypothetical protein n=1 Tax=Mucilaginibacter sp. JRF TaxID=2780088 RepID=UPI00187F160B|nr:hypothetical protein [Mucilaginibacter sp. JRF]MBE9583818.1 hypothetical protein [Mucilaginibacter sp. JRF]